LIGENLMANERKVLTRRGIEVDAPESLTLENAAAALDVSAQYLREAIRRGELAMMPRKRIGGTAGKVRVSFDELVRWLNEDNGGDDVLDKSSA